MLIAPSLPLLVISVSVNCFLVLVEVDALIKWWSQRCTGGPFVKDKGKISVQMDQCNSPSPVSDLTEESNISVTDDEEESTSTARKTGAEVDKVPERILDPKSLTQRGNIYGRCEKGTGRDEHTTYISSVVTK